MAVRLVQILVISGWAFTPALGQSAFTSPYMPYGAFDRLQTSIIEAGGATLTIGVAPGRTALARHSLISWIERSAQAVSIYYGRFPVRSVRILIVPAAGRGVTGGQAFNARGAAIRLQVGRDSTAHDLGRDWKSVHEMVHLALPDVARRHLWLSEGVATYVESIARVQAGHLTEEKIWGEFVRDMHQGLPGTGDRGLDFTPTWGRTHWGGALFCLLADIEIRKRSGNRIGLQTALRGILAAGGDYEQHWPIDRILRTADAATTHAVLQELYAKMRATPYAPDLDTLWHDLGVSVRDGRVLFDNDAVHAHIRQAITAPLPPPS